MRYRATKNCHLRGGHYYGGGQYCKHCNMPRRMGGTRTRVAKTHTHKRSMGMNLEEVMASRRPVPKPKEKPSFVRRAVSWMRRAFG